MNSQEPKMVYHRYFARSAYPGHRVVRIVRTFGQGYTVQRVLFDPEEDIERAEYSGRNYREAVKLADSWCWSIVSMQHWYEMFNAERGADHAS